MQDHPAVGGGDPGHLADALLRVRQVIDGGVAQHAVERLVGKGQCLRDAADQGDRHSLLDRLPARAGKHDGRRLERIDVESARPQRACVAGVRCGHLEHPATRPRGERVDAGALHAAHDEVVVRHAGESVAHPGRIPLPLDCEVAARHRRSAHPSVRT